MIREVSPLFEEPDTPEWLSLPSWIREDIVHYVRAGQVEARTTLYRALCNDFTGAVCMAGDDLRPVLRELAVGLVCYLPAQCHGSPAAVTAWVASRGLEGLSGRGRASV